MSYRQFGPILRRVVRIRARGDAADGLLLERFALHGDQAAFETLLERYAPLVYGVCRRVLANPHDADDAFQATVLVLARKAKSIREGSLGSWLHGVAYRVAAEVRTKAARRAHHESEVAVREHDCTVSSDADPAVTAARREAYRLLDDELQRLPVKYRTPLVLCYLQGLTNEEAARQLGWAPGSISKLLAKGREQLQGRLARRGVALPTATLVALLAEEAAPAAVPRCLFGVIFQGAASGAASQSWAATVPLPIVDLVEGVLSAMLTARLKLVAVVVLSIGIIGAATGIGLWPRGNAQPAADQSASRVTPVVAEQPPKKHAVDELMDEFLNADADLAKKFPEEKKKALAVDPRKLARQKADVARQSLEGRFNEFLDGRGTFDFLFQSATRLLQAELAVAENDEEKLAAHERSWKLAAIFEVVNKARYDAQRISIQDYADTVLFRIDMQQKWLEARAATSKKQK